MANSNETAPVDTDILISGGGAAGYSLAMALQHRCPQYRIALAEANVPTTGQTSGGFDARLIALSLQSLAYFSRFSCGQEIMTCSTDIRHIHVSDQGRAGQCMLHADEIGHPRLGGVIALQDLGRVLQACLDKSLQRFQPDSIVQIEQKPDFILATLKSGQKIRARLLVIAEGADSSTAALLSCQPKVYEYGQQAIVANVRLQQHHDYWAFERFTAQGPLAILPMADNCASLVWCMNAEQAEQIQALSDNNFLSELQRAFGFRLGRFAEVSPRFSYPLALTHRHDALLHRAVVVANSAQTLHPIAGQGFNLGLRDIQALSDVVAQSADPGAYQSLRQFQILRRQDRQQTVQLTDALVRLFSNNNPLLALARNAGLLKFALTPSLTRQFASTAMGLGRHQKGLLSMETESFSAGTES